MSDKIIQINTTELKQKFNEVLGYTGSTGKLQFEIGNLKDYLNANKWYNLSASIDKADAELDVLRQGLKELKALLVNAGCAID